MEPQIFSPQGLNQCDSRRLIGKNAPEQFPRNSPWTKNAIPLHQLFTVTHNFRFTMLNYYFKNQVICIGSANMNTNARILIIDDDPTILETLKVALESEGYAVNTAQNGKEAIEKSHSNFFNLAIVDWRLPDIEGTKLLSKFKDRTPRMVRIMLTGYPSIENAVDAVNRHADAFLLKPIAISKLLATIKDLLKEQEKSDNFCQEKIAEYLETRTIQFIENSRKREEKSS